MFRVSNLRKDPMGSDKENNNAADRGLTDYIKKQSDDRSETDINTQRVIDDTQARLDYLMDKNRDNIIRVIGEINSLGKNLSNSLVVLTGIVFTLFAGFIGMTTEINFGMEQKCVVALILVSALLSIIFGFIHTYSEIKFWREWLELYDRNNSIQLNYNWGSINDLQDLLSENETSVPRSSRNLFLIFQIVSVVVSLIGLLWLSLTIIDI